MSKIEVPKIEDMLDAGVHFGHTTRQWNPLNEPFVFKRISGKYIFDLRETQEKLRRAADFLSQAVAEDKEVLLVGLRRQSADLVKEIGEETGMPYMSGRWVGGLLTNYDQVIENVRKLKNLEEGLEKGEFDYYTKKERLEIKRQIEKLERDFGGVREMKELPDIVVLASARKCLTALREAVQLDIPVVAVVDTNADPGEVAYPIPANDDSIRSLEMIFRVLESALLGTDIQESVEEKGKGEGERESSGKAGSIDDLELPSRAVNALKKNKIEERSELRKMTKEELLKLKGIGEKTAKKILSVLE